jgi:hypothetical protein
VVSLLIQENREVNQMIRKNFGTANAKAWSGEHSQLMRAGSSHNPIRKWRDPRDHYHSTNDAVPLDISFRHYFIHLFLEYWCVQRLPVLVWWYLAPSLPCRPLVELHSEWVTNANDMTQRFGILKVSLASSIPY